MNRKTDWDAVIKRAELSVAGQYNHELLLGPVVLSNRFTTVIAGLKCHAFHQLGWHDDLVDEIIKTCKRGHVDDLTFNDHKYCQFYLYGLARSAGRLDDIVREIGAFEADGEQINRASKGVRSTLVIKRRKKPVSH